MLKLANGRVYTGEQAKNNMLIDELGGLHAAIQAAAQKAGIEGEPTIINMNGGKGLGALFSTQATNLANHWRRVLPANCSNKRRSKPHRPPLGKYSFKRRIA